MENKTLNHLNTKVWYRLVKVIFILLFVIVLLIANGLIFSETDFKQVSLKDTKISCTYGEKKEFMASVVSSYLFSSDDFKDGKFDYKYFFERYGNEYDIRDIINECKPQTDAYFDPFAYQRVMELIGDDRLKMGKGEALNFISDSEMNQIQSETAKIEKAYGSDKIKYLDFSVKMFDVAPVFSHAPFFKVFLLTNLIILAVFEIFRRAFYYITLGSLRPKKD